MFVIIVPFVKFFMMGMFQKNEDFKSLKKIQLLTDLNKNLAFNSRA